MILVLWGIGCTLFGLFVGELILFFLRGFDTPLISLRSIVPSCRGNGLCVLIWPWELTN